MLELTTMQQNLVTENHSLIYWYINYRHLDIDEWYGLLAIELCLSAQKHDPTKGKLSTYYKIRCDNLVADEYKKSTTQKKSHNGHTELKDYQSESPRENQAFNMDMDTLFASTFGEVLKMKSHGFTQVEIANKLGVTQSYISRIIAEYRREYYAND